jgi:hypothetical protein
MAGTKINIYASVSNADVDNIELVLTKTFRGMCVASLTHWNDIAVPAIAAGSVIEIDGDMFEFSSDEAIGTIAGDGTRFIKLIPSGSTVTAVFTATAPVWDKTRQGWYSPTGGEETYRYLPFDMYAYSGAYYDKFERYFSGGYIRTDMLKLITGFTNAIAAPDGQGYDTIIAYQFPPGWTRDNTHVIDAKIYGINWLTDGNLASYPPHISLTDAIKVKVTVGNPTQSYHGVGYQLLVERIY